LRLKAVEDAFRMTNYLSDKNERLSLKERITASFGKRSVPKD